MKIQIAQRIAAGVACLGMLMPQAALAAPASQVADVALRDGGIFVGKVVSTQGAPVASAAVSIRQGDNEVAQTVTNEEGVFAAQGLHNGVYQVVADNGVASYRFWSAEMAPPAANNSALIVTGNTVVNGQGGIGSWVRNHPLLVAAGVATAIAVPLAVADDDDPAS